MEIKFTFIGKEKIKELSNHKFKSQAVSVNNGLENQVPKAIFEAYTKSNMKPEKSDEKGLKVKINEIDSQIISSNEGNFSQSNKEIPISKESQEEILINEYNNLSLQSKNLQLENNKLQQRIKELKNMSINKSSMLIFFYI